VPYRAISQLHSKKGGVFVRTKRGLGTRAKKGVALSAGQNKGVFITEGVGAQVRQRGHSCEGRLLKGSRVLVNKKH
jgi:hypothetical protein